VKFQLHNILRASSHNILNILDVQDGQKSLLVGNTNTGMSDLVIDSQIFGS